MPSPDPIPTTLSDHLRQLGLGHTAADLNDLIARATQKRWSPVVLLEQLAQAELAARLHQRVERRLHDARLGRFKPLADFEWTWPTQLHRPTVERVFTLDFLAHPENVIIVAAHGLGKTMLAKNLVHQAILAGHSARLVTAADLILELHRLVPTRVDFQHTYDTPADAAGHIKATLVGNSATLIVTGGEVVLGSSQSILFFEFDGPRERKVHVQVLGRGDS